jgi:hypothetical protein
MCLCLHMYTNCMFVGTYFVTFLLQLATKLKMIFRQHWIRGQGGEMMDEKTANRHCHTEWSRQTP